ncbi:MAG TPA: hypothetical protein VNF08_06395 [Acidimicrobiales bacterium]|nr:hypothetical protein [Acidimicrobiales bacterium]
MKFVPTIATGLPATQLATPGITELTLGGRTPNDHESIFMAVPHVVLDELTAVWTGLHEAIPVESSSPTEMIDCNSGLTAQFAALIELKHVEMVTTRPWVGLVVQAVVHQESTV